MCRKQNIIFLLLLLVSSSCKKMLEVPPPDTKLTSDNMFEDDKLAASVLTNIYAKLSQSAGSLNGISITNLSLVGGLAADELTLFGGTANGNVNLQEYHFNRVFPGSTGSGAQSIWNSAYQNIYTTNIALEKLAAAPLLSLSVKQQLTGEAYFLRALHYFYLVQLFGDVPLLTSSDYRLASVATRTPKSEVEKLITEDLKHARELLNAAYLNADALSAATDRARPNKATATALLARHYLYTGKWAEAEIEASAIISNTAVYDTVSLINTFKKESKEVIWQLQPVEMGWNTPEARIWILPVTGPGTGAGNGNKPVYLSASLVNSFETGDNRKTIWTNNVTANGIDYYYSYKYKSAKFNDPVTEYSVVFRLGEQYLIRAEARAQQEKITEALADLNIIRKRARLESATVNNKNELLEKIAQERRVELFTEWGHRWLDLKRTETINEVMNAEAAIKGSNWKSSSQLWPIPAYDIFQNPKLTQNPDYGVIYESDF